MGDWFFIHISLPELIALIVLAICVLILAVGFLAEFIERRTRNWWPRRKSKKDTAP